MKLNSIWSQKKLAFYLYKQPVCFTVYTAFYSQSLGSSRLSPELNTQYSGIS